MCSRSHLPQLKSNKDKRVSVTVHVYYCEGETNPSILPELTQTVCSAADCRFRTFGTVSFLHLLLFTAMWDQLENKKKRTQLICRIKRY